MRKDLCICFGRRISTEALKSESESESEGKSVKLIDREQEVDMDDALAQELAFYTQALEGTRPSDCYADMVKNGAHIIKNKHKGVLLVEKRKIEEAEERRKAGSLRKWLKRFRLGSSKRGQNRKAGDRICQEMEEVEAKEWV
ncbi:hypothetical protein Vadar_007342 [Vaccinium darrowii]|uniref:Uncharacterized protein n=1 Tax=Vaccinium darrowii TaxID=229202 RepID=A0ACB7YLZ9_9ERIC|nr:hypothetical protein Vadar_007342 [Vaccinium darrowii]